MTPMTAMLPSQTYKQLVTFFSVFIIPVRGDTVLGGSILYMAAGEHGSHGSHGRPYGG